MENGKEGGLVQKPAKQPLKEKNVSVDLIKLQQALADRMAISVVLALPGVVQQGQVWRNADQSNAHWEIKYLRLRGILIHNKENYSLVLLRGAI